MAATVIFLTSGTTWTVPSDWNSSSNTVEAIGAGGSGFGTGAGGGAYAQISNLTLTPGGTVAFQIGTPGGSSGAGALPTANTWFVNGATLVAAGAIQLSSSGGPVANCIGTVKTAGGNGSTGGGGAGGPDGAGQNASGTTGGNGDAGVVGGGAGGTTGNPGGTGTIWTQSSDAAKAGPGGGGGSGANGGNYGGGGGQAGASAPGLIIVTYTIGGVTTPADLATAHSNILPLPRYMPVVARTSYALPPFRIAIAPTPTSFFQSGHDPLPRIPPIPIELRTAFVFTPFAQAVAATPADFFQAGFDPLPFIPPLPLTLRTSYTDVGTFKVPVPASTPDSLPIAFSEFSLRPYYMPVECRTSYTRPPNAVPVAATPTQLAFLSSTMDNEAVFLPKKYRSIFYTSEPSWHQIPVIRRPLQRIPLFFSIPWIEYEYAVNTFINEMNFNFVSLGVAQTNLVPLRTATDPDRFADETNALIKQINALVVGLPNSPSRIPFFLAISTDQLTMVINELIEDVNARFITAFS